MTVAEIFPTKPIEFSNPSNSVGVLAVSRAILGTIWEKGPIRRSIITGLVASLALAGCGSGDPQLSLNSVGKEIRNEVLANRPDTMRGSLRLTDDGECYVIRDSDETVGACFGEPNYVGFVWSTQSGVELRVDRLPERPKFPLAQRTDLDSAQHTAVSPTQALAAIQGVEAQLAQPA